MLRILFVCNNNQVYSPAAEAILKRYIRNNKVEGNYEVDSAGVNTMLEGGYPNLAIMKKASDMGYLITHRTRKLNDLDIERHNYIIVFGGRLFQNLYSRSKDDFKLIKLFPAQDFLTDNAYEGFASEAFEEYNAGRVINALEDICTGLWKYIVEEQTYIEEN